MINTHDFFKLFTLISLLILTKFVNADDTFVVGKWVYSEQLQQGMQLKTADGKTLTVVQPWLKHSESMTTYNLEVKDNHTYFVGNNKLWVHNTCDETWWQRQKRRAREFVYGKQPTGPSTYNIPHIGEITTEHFTITNATNRVLYNTQNMTVYNLSEPHAIRMITLELEAPVASSEAAAQEIAGVVNRLNNTARVTGEEISVGLSIKNTTLRDLVVQELKIFSPTTPTRSDVVIHLGGQ